LREIAQKKLLSGTLTEALRILSLPSSTGEEPYSIAITLLDTGLNPSQFSVDAIDISENALALARRAVYRKNSFRGKQEEHIKSRYFTSEGNLFRLSELVKKQVNFSQGNIFDANFLPGNNIYDIVFCRNLLIYFDADDKKRAFGKLERLLKKDGLLFIGHSESGAVPEDKFTKTGIAKAFAFLNRPPEKKATKEIKQPKSATPLKPRKKILSKPFPDTTTIIEKKDVKPKPEVTQQKPLESLEKARQLADAGNLDEAKEICLQHLGRNSDDAQAHFLLGLISVATGNEQIGEQYYRKALYLDPKHYETLIHLSFLVDQQGDKPGAERLRNRAERVNKESA
jgi:chemotaxis protein methyltransferase WspC